MSRPEGNGRPPRQNGAVPLDVSALTVPASRSSERMDSSLFQSSEWYAAATLAERIDTPRATTQERPGDTDAARHTLDAWRQQPPFDQKSLFAQRLELDGITEEDLL